MGCPCAREVELENAAGLDRERLRRSLGFGLRRPDTARPPNLHGWLRYGITALLCKGAPSGTVVRTDRHGGPRSRLAVSLMRGRAGSPLTPGHSGE